MTPGFDGTLRPVDVRPGNAPPRPAADAPPQSESAERPAGHGSLPYQPALDGLRAVAVLSVIGYHLNEHWALGGFLGVDAFFVLSGFLITTLLVREHRRTGGIRVLAFWGRRIRRLLPALLLVLGFVALYTHFAVPPWNRTAIRADGIASLFYVANWRFVLNEQSYFTLFSAASPLRHTWSLAIEEQFYLVWPLVVIACLALARGSLRLLAAVCVVGTIGSVALMASLYRVGDPSRAYYGTDSHAHTLLIGALLALVLLTWVPARAVRTALAAAGVVALVAMLVAMNRMSDTASFYYRGGSVLFAVTVAVVIAAAMSGGPVRGGLALPPLPWIGRISYGLYLWHWPLIVWLVPTRVDVSGPKLTLLRIAATFAAATASYYLVERPIREGAHRRARTYAWLAPVGVTVAAFALVASAAGATPPPSYVLNIGDPIRCGHPQPAELQAARRENQRRGPLDLPSRARDLRLLLVGDSTACSLWPGLRVVGRANHLAVAQGSVFGCGVASGEITTTRGEQITPHSERCHQLGDDALRTMLPKARPDVVVWMSGWEKSDLVVDGETLVSGTRAGDRAMLARMDDALAQLTRGGARVVLVNVAAPAPNDAQGTTNTSNAVDDASYRRLDSINRRFARRHPGVVTFVDLAARVCPGGPPCPELVGGERIRPDGRHFTPEAATRSSRWLLTQIARRQG